MKYEIQKNLGGAAVYSLSTISCLIMWLIGVKTADGNAFPWIIVLAVIGVLLLIAALVNFIRTRLFFKKMNGMNVRESYEFSKSLQSEIEKDFIRAEKNVCRIAVGAFVYIGILLAVLLFAAFACGRLGMTYAAIPVMAVIYVAVIMLLVKLFLPVPYVEPDMKFLLDETKYPLFYQTARKAAEIAGCKLKVRLYLTSDGISVNESGGCARVCLDPVTTSLLTRDELFNVFLHEFAHIVNVDTKRSNRYAAIRAKLCHEYARLNRLFYLFTSDFSVRAGFYSEIYQLMSSRYHETQADALVIKRGDSQTYINATSKACMLSLYNEMPQRELQYDIYASEKVPENLISADLNNFYNYKNKYREKWRKRMLKEIPARISSHPTFRMRMDNAGCTDFDDTQSEKDVDFIGEQNAFVAEADRIAFEMIAGEYAARRRNLYTERKEQMEKYDAAMAEGRKLDPEELILSIKAFYGVDNEKVKEIVGNMLKEDENSAYGHYFKGILLFDEDDKACVEHFYAASRLNFRLAESAMQHVGEFALKTGDAELLEKYRNDVGDVVQGAYDENESSEIKSTTELRFCELCKDEINGIVGKIRAICGSTVIRIYMASYTENGFVWHAVMLEYAKGATEEERMLVYEKTFNYLDNISNVNFMLLDSEDKRRLRAIRSVGGSLVYSAQSEGK